MLPPCLCLQEAIPSGERKGEMSIEASFSFDLSFSVPPFARRRGFSAPPAPSPLWYAPMERGGGRKRKRADLKGAAAIFKPFFFFFCHPVLRAWAQLGVTGAAAGGWRACPQGGRAVRAPSPTHLGAGPCSGGLRALTPGTGRGRRGPARCGRGRSAGPEGEAARRGWDLVATSRSGPGRQRGRRDAR